MTARTRARGDHVRGDLARDGMARLLVFRVGDERFGVALRAVDEVIEMPRVERLPDAPIHVAGVSTVRGELVMVYDPRPLLSVASLADQIADGAATARGGTALLFHRSSRRVGFLVDDVFDALAIQTAELNAAPGIATDDMVIGLVRRGTELIAVLDSDALLDVALTSEPLEEKPI